MLKPRLRGAARRAHGSSALVHAMRDLIASNAPLRNGTHKARQNGPKHYPGDPTGAAAPLVCLSPLSFFKQRKMVPPEVVGLVERLVKKRTAKDIATGGRWFSRAVGKKRTAKDGVPEGRIVSQSGS